MGVDGFLRQLSAAVDQTHLQQFAGETLVVDALSWLHKACYGCAYELSTGRDTDKYVQYMLRKVDMVRSCGVAKVVLVFDGQRLPLKEKRQSYKEENRKRALQAMAASKRLQGDDRQDELNKAYQLFQRSVSITPKIISNVMNALRSARVPFVVAPFEADAQMVWMCKEGLAAGIVTEDSDVVVYCLTANVSCPVLVKLEDNGSAQAVSRSILHNNSAKASSSALLRKIHFLTSGEKEATRMFVQVCVLAGCDFIDSLPNVGFATAVKHIFNFRGAPAHLRVQRLVSKLSSSGTKVPSDFMQQFLKAETIFFHHIVFNSKKRSSEFLINCRHDNCFADILQRANESLGITSPEDEADLTSTALQEDLHGLVTSTQGFLGQVRSREIVEQIYKGEVCARTLRSLSESPASSQQWQPDGVQVGRRSFDAPRSVGEPPSGVREAEQGFHTTVTQRKASKPSPEVTAQEIENKKRLQAQERVSSMQGLVRAYKSTAPTQVAASANSETQQWLMSATRVRVTEPNHSKAFSTAGAPAPSARILSSTAAVVKATKVTATSMKNLIAMHSQSVQASKSPDGQAPAAKAVPQSAPGRRKRPLPAAKPIANSARKARTLAHKTTPGSGGKKTLFDFFQKQS
ncbi:Rad2 nuclease [Phytophthora pseudosyringae]|uniref:Exonuclease 1 n=1 Tax=Phytophthora pseudosyringae TaxID=221518 RepID=A0A8T1VXW1_9STRA|nr:Rad2 nuclease [Phytophthora pseudosyringae]